MEIKGRKETVVVKELHLVEAFGTNDFARVTAHLTAQGTSAALPSYGSPLHLAISLSNKSTIDSLIEYYAADLPRWICQINSPSMETPLHLAAKLGRIEVIDSLYAISALNDTQRDSLGRVAYDVAKNEKTAEALKAKKNEFINEVYRIVRVSLNDPNFGGGKVIEFFKNNQRALDYLKLGWIDINAPIDAETEHAMLHYAAKNENAELLQW
ncbi:MAG: hypothetical protein SGCHY_005477, partial [Lobulomycetales sp.]